ncbi:protein kinase-like domain, Phloem protein 2-like protein [Artemisia annua]|uniref:Protein kinase-like domain, Phloem protein 2-like protein n=1 Tax=Artemisia annua TaxID=35608 RepID=A0A2U1KFG9_ARTAN|nr:protein kinase-like domain, Phloem protein 2-like protein [Artemisia annua]
MAFMKDYDHLKIQMKDIISATNNFDPTKVIGDSGFGRVYKGKLSLPEGQTTVAFKQLDRRLGQGWMILVYEYASRGSLDRYLSDASLTWTQRLKICVGAAQSDVYSFGVMLFEVLSGRLCCEYRNGELTSILVPKWKRFFDKKRLDEIILAGLKEQMEPGSLDSFSAISYRCLKRAREERPTMVEVLKELEFALQQQEVFEDIGKKVNFEKLIKIADTAVPPLSYVSQSHLFVLFLNGVLVDYGKTWISTNMREEISEIVSAIKCVTEEQFQQEVVEYSRQTYVNTYYIDSIEFLPVEQEKYGTHADNNKVDIKALSNSDTEWEQKFPSDYQDIINISKDVLPFSTKKELYFLLRKGFLIDKDKMWFSISKDIKKRFMIPAASFLPGGKWEWKPLPESRL